METTEVFARNLRQKLEEKGRTQAMLARHLNDLYGTSFTNTHIVRLLRSTLLKGEYRTNTAYCTPLIDADTWDALQVALDKNVKHASKKRVYLFAGLIKCPCCGRLLGGCFDGSKKYYRCANKYYGTCSIGCHVSEAKLEKWLLENIEDDFKVNVTMKPKEKKEDPKKYKDRLDRLNEMYLLGNISQADYKKKTAELQTKIAELQKIAPLKTQNFSADWKEIYSLLDDEHKRSFWRGIVSSISVDIETAGFKILY